MWLDEWLFNEGMTQQDFAKQVGISREYLNRIIGGAVRGSPDVAKKIQELTSGKVTLEEILFGDRTQRKKPPKERK